MVSEMLLHSISKSAIELLIKDLMTPKIKGVAAKFNLQRPLYYWYAIEHSSNFLYRIIGRKEF